VTTRNELRARHLEVGVDTDLEINELVIGVRHSF